ncbi:DtxR family Mn-dependent transcriptional regulator [Methanofollis sp. W23]|uniref:metal-dependent transcriptional regulator n=1 Tax=Methanofollis sp. W23 TaxID=2817849 RepID=UPI001AE75F1C|nr:metal-dependent transcriptional regulator [Methanofollis sp. W23]MBP2147108.1 DtxR family Mn-dependent transcriptional regulator [Methanofollis sp. W23]
MNSSVREDCLEAVLTLVQEHQRPVTEREIDEVVEAASSEVTTAVRVLAEEGYLRNEDGGYLLTPPGHDAAEVVLRKHRVLECFLHEMLGMDVGAASKEACILEHAVSDEAIDRLSSYIEDPHGDLPPARRGLRHRRGPRAAACPVGATPNGRRPLLDCSEGETVKVAVIQCIGRNRRLIDLGLIPGREIAVRRKLHNNALVVGVMGADIALSPEVASTIFVERTG